MAKIRPCVSCKRTVETREFSDENYYCFDCAIRKGKNLEKELNKKIRDYKKERHYQDDTKDDMLNMLNRVGLMMAFTPERELIFEFSTEEVKNIFNKTEEEAQHEEKMKKEAQELLQKLAQTIKDKNIKRVIDLISTLIDQIRKEELFKEFIDDGDFINFQVNELSNFMFYVIDHASPEEGDILTRQYMEVTKIFGEILSGLDLEIRGYWYEKQGNYTEAAKYYVDAMKKAFDNENQGEMYDEYYEDFLRVNKNLKNWIQLITREMDLTELNLKLGEQFERENTSKIRKFDELSAFEEENKRIYDLIGDINKFYLLSNSKEDFIKISHQLSALHNLTKLVKSKEGWSKFVAAAYNVFYEGTGSGERIPLGSKYKDGSGRLLSDSIIMDIKRLRGGSEHELLENDKNIKLYKDTIKIIEKYTNKKSICDLDEKEFKEFQGQILVRLIGFLGDMNEWVKSQIN